MILFCNIDLPIYLSFSMSVSFQRGTRKYEAATQEGPETRHKVESSGRKFYGIHMKAENSTQEYNQNPFKQKIGAAVNQVNTETVETHCVDNNQHYYRPDRNLSRRPGREGETRPPRVCYYC